MEASTAASGDSNLKLDGPDDLSRGKAIDETQAYDWEIDMSQVLCINLLAEGAFGRVFYGTYNQTDVAVKLMHLPSNVKRKEMEDMKLCFKQEIAVWHKLSHPNVVQFIGASLRDTNLKVPLEAKMRPGAPVWAIVTEYMSDGSLKSYLQNRRQRLPIRKALKLILDVAQGLKYLHSLNIVHRDLKSENILMDGNGTLKIADFGVARTEAANPVDMTCETGTVRWMAPEIIDHKPYDRKVDVYSFAIVMWEILTGDLPFRNLTFVQLATAVVTKGIRPEIPPWVPVELSSLLQACWQGPADKRPDFPEIVEKLENFEAKVAEGASEPTGGCGCTIM